MKLTVFCENCGRDAASCETEHKELLGSLIFCAHANGHSVHKLVPLIDGARVTNEKLMLDHYQNHDVIIKCTQPGCMNAGGTHTYTYKIPICLIAAMAIGVHSAHEGHPLHITLDGVVIHSSQ